MDERIRTLAMSGTAVTLIVGTALWGCKNSGNPIGPGGELANLISNPTFMVDGKPSLDGWTCPDTSGFVFSAEVPPGQAGNSLRMPVSWFGPIRYAGIWTTVPIPAGPHVFELRCWARRENFGGWMLLYRPGDPVDSVSRAQLIPITDTTWTLYRTRDTIVSEQPDSIIIYLGRGETELAGGWTSYYGCVFTQLQ